MYIYEPIRSDKEAFYSFMRNFLYPICKKPHIGLYESVFQKLKHGEVYIDGQKYTYREYDKVQRFFIEILLKEREQCMDASFERALYSQEN